MRPKHLTIGMFCRTITGVGVIYRLDGLATRQKTSFRSALGRSPSSAPPSKQEAGAKGRARCASYERRRAPSRPWPRKPYRHEAPQSAVQRNNILPAERSSAQDVSTTESVAGGVRSQIQPIPTEYRGLRFRSRLEARWAVLFTEIGIDYRYEHEGFKLPCGERYLPDFWFPHIQMWGEVKPAEMTESERRRCRELATGTQRPVLRLEGLPACKTYWACMPGLDFLDVDETDFLLDIDYHKRKYYDEEHRLFGCTWGMYPDDFTEQYKQAVWWANNARFGRIA